MCETKQNEREAEVLIRALRPDETDLLRDFLYESLFVHEGEAPFPKEIVYKPELRIYYEDFGTGPADTCLLAERDGRAAGAVWARIMDDYGHVDDETPSLAISLFPQYRKQGIGTRLLAEMLALLKARGWRRVSLSVQKANYAVRMYEKAGFTPVREDSEEYIMVREL